MTDQVLKILGCYRSENPGVLTNLARIINHGRLGGTGRVIILPVAQGFEHGPARSFAPNPPAYDPAYHFQLAIDAGLNAYASLLGFLEASAADFAGEIAVDSQTECPRSAARRKGPTRCVDSFGLRCSASGVVAIGYTIYPGTAERRLQYEQLRELASEARAAGLVVVGGVIRAAAALAKTAKMPLT